MGHSKRVWSSTHLAGFGLCITAINCSAGMSTPETTDVAASEITPHTRAEAPPKCPTACKPHACTTVAPTNALITDWKDVAEGGMFIDNDSYSNPSPNWWEGFFGGPYVYPSLDPCSDAAVPAYPLTQSTNGQWNVVGKVGTWSGFGLWLAPCSVDMSAYRGISLTIWGEVGETKSVNFNVMTSEDSKRNECMTNIGTCNPATNTCAAPSTKLAVPQKPGTPVTILWSDLAGGSPFANVDPTQIVGFHFAFNRVEWGGVVTPPFPVDVNIGTIQLVK